MGEPTSCAMVLAIASLRSLSAPDSLRSQSARSAATALSTSSGVPSGIEPIISSVDAERTSIDPWPDCGCQPPLMYKSRYCVVFADAPVIRFPTHYSGVRTPACRVDNCVDALIVAVPPAFTGTSGATMGKLCFG